MTTSRLGTYQLIEPLKSGALAELFLARPGSPLEHGPAEWVVIKRLVRALVEDPERAAHVPDRAREVQGLSHRNLVQVLDVGRDDDQHWIACADAPGAPLRELLDAFLARGESMPVPLAAGLMREVCQALGALHASGPARVHGAVSVRSIRLCLDGVVRLDDYGFAPVAGKPADAARSEQLGFLSPEQVLGRPLDGRSDVFSVGLVLFELLTGLRLYGASNNAATLQMVLDAQVPPLRSLNPSLPEALDVTVLKALARAPEDRFQTAAELGAALAAFSDGGPFSISVALDRELPEVRTSETALRQRLAKGTPTSMSSTPAPTSSPTASTTPPPADPATVEPGASDVGDEAEPVDAKKPRKASSRKSKGKKSAGASGTDGEATDAEESDGAVASAGEPSDAEAKSPPAPASGFGSSAEGAVTDASTPSGGSTSSATQAAAAPPRDGSDALSPSPELPAASITTEGAEKPGEKRAEAPAIPGAQQGPDARPLAAGSSAAVPAPITPEAGSASGKPDATTPVTSTVGTGSTPQPASTPAASAVAASDAAPKADGLPSSPPASQAVAAPGPVVSPRAEVASKAPAATEKVGAPTGSSPVQAGAPATAVTSSAPATAAIGAASQAPPAAAAPAAPAGSTSQVPPAAAAPAAPAGSPSQVPPAAAAPAAPAGSPSQVPPAAAAPAAPAGSPSQVPPAAAAPAAPAGSPSQVPPAAAAPAAPAGSPSQVPPVAAAPASPAGSTSRVPPAAAAPASPVAITATSPVDLPLYRAPDEDDEEEEEERTQLINTAIIAASLPAMLAEPLGVTPRADSQVPPRADAAPRRTGVAVRPATGGTHAGPAPRPGGTSPGKPRPAGLGPGAARPGGTNAGTPRPTGPTSNPGGDPRVGASRPGTNPAMRTPQLGSPRVAQPRPAAPGTTAPTGRTSSPTGTPPESDLFAPQPRRTSSRTAIPSQAGQTPVRRPNTRPGEAPPSARGTGRVGSNPGPGRRSPSGDQPQVRQGTGTPVARTFSASHPAFDALQLAAEVAKQSASRAKGAQPEVEILFSNTASESPARQPVEAHRSQPPPSEPSRALDADKRPNVVPVRSAAKEPVSTPVPKGLYYLAGAMALFLMLGLGLILRSPSEAVVVIDVAPAESAMITIGGRQVKSGEKVSFPPGEYELVASAKGFKRHTQRITVFEGAPTSTYPIMLEADEPVEEKSVVPEVTGAKFTLHFTSATPDVEVWVDGVSVGVTPKASVSLEVGRSYRYEARAKGHEPVEGLVGSYGASELAVPLTLRKASDRSSRTGRGKLVLSTVPSGAEIHLNGVPTGRRTPVTAGLPIEIPAGRHVLVFRLGDRASAPQRVTLGDGQAIMLDSVAVDGTP